MNTYLCKYCLATTHKRIELSIPGHTTQSFFCCVSHRREYIKECIKDLVTNTVNTYDVNTKENIAKDFHTYLMDTIWIMRKMNPTKLHKSITDMGMQLWKDFMNKHYINEDKL